MHIPKHIEPRNRYAGSDNRPATAAFDSADYTSCDTDVSMDHPHSCDGVKGAALNFGYAVKMREKQKKKKNRQQLTQSGEKQPSVVSLVFEQFGYWGHAAEDYLNTLRNQRM